MLQVQNRFFADIDFKSLLARGKRISEALFSWCWFSVIRRFHEPYEIPNFSFERHIGDQPVTGLSVQARHVACIRVTIGVSIFHVKDENKIVTVSEIHAGVPSEVGLLLSSAFLVKKSCR